MGTFGDITFHPATVDDIPIIQNLSSRIWRQHYPGIITHAQIDYMLGKMYASEVIADEIRNRGYHYILVKERDLVVGYIAYRYDDATNAILISKLYLLPSLHGKGIGRQMLQHVKDDAMRSGAGTIYLFVNRNNVKAIAAYERFGFVSADSIVTDIGGGFFMDDHRMELKL
jgi:ribosomal protein S18 acetylase RimI-like enzyme